MQIFLHIVKRWCIPAKKAIAYIRVSTEGQFGDDKYGVDSQKQAIFDFANIYRSLLMFVVEQERKNIALRTSKGRQLKAQCGGDSGGNKPYGYSVLDGF